MVFIQSWCKPSTDMEFMENRNILSKWLNIFEIFENIRSSNQIESNTEIQSLNMFRSDILNIRKARIGSNMQCFKFFGQPRSNQLKKL